MSKEALAIVMIIRDVEASRRNRNDVIRGLDQRMANRPDMFDTCRSYAMVEYLNLRSSFVPSILIMTLSINNVLKIIRMGHVVDSKDVNTVLSFRIRYNVNAMCYKRPTKILKLQSLGRERLGIYDVDRPTRLASREGIMENAKTREPRKARPVRILTSGKKQSAGRMEVYVLAEHRVVDGDKVCIVDCGVDGLAEDAENSGEAIEWAGEKDASAYCDGREGESLRAWERGF